MLWRLAIALVLGVLIGFGAGWVANDASSPTSTRIVTTHDRPSPYSSGNAYGP